MRSARSFAARRPDQDPYHAEPDERAGKDGEPWIEPGTVECPSSDPDSIGWLSATARLACFGGEPLTLDGTIDDCYASETPVAWQQSGCLLLPPDYVPLDTFTSFLIIYAAPGVQLPTGGGGFDVRVTGHFDDSAAETCAVLASPDPDFGYSAITPAERAVLSCRGQFVATHIEVR
jgi:hypothetical protein